MRQGMKDSMRMFAIAAVLLILFGVIGLLLQQSGHGTDVQPIQAAPVDMRQQNLLVDATWLADKMDAVNVPLVVIDLSPLEQYTREHIPSAIHLWWQDTMNLNGAGYGEAFNLSASSSYTPLLGATQDDLIVVYDNSASEHASRLVWQLRTSGYSRAAVLDGGLAAWKGLGQPVINGSTQPKAVSTPEEIWIGANEITTPELKAELDDPNLVVIDSRSVEQQQDTINDTVRVGQIPGSKSLPSASVMRDDGTIIPPDDLEAVFTSLGVSPESKVVVYGRFGVETGQVWLALRVAGYENVRVYDDGWLAWGYDARLPIEPLEVTAP